MGPLTWRQRLELLGLWLRDRLPVSHHWPALVAFLVALAFRLWNTFPIFYYGDDAEYAIVAGYLADDWRNLAYPDIEGFGPTPFVSQPPFLLYLFALAGKITGDLEMAATAVCIVLGSLTSVVLYALGVKLQGRTMGAVAGLFCAVMPYHVLLSRKAYLDVGMAFFMALTVLVFIHWLDRRTTGWAIATGLCAGAAVMSKLPGVFILVPLLVGVILEWWAAGRASLDPVHRRLGRRELRHLAAHTSTAIVPVALLGGAYVGLLWYLKSTVNLLTKLGWQWGRVGGTTAGATNALADHPWHWYLTSSVSSLPAQAGLLISLLAVAGATYLWRTRGPRTRIVVLLLWPLTFLLFLTLSHRKEWFYIVPLLVPVALLAAAPLQPLVRWIQRGGLVFWRPGPRRAGAIAIVTLVLFTGVAAAQPTAVTMQEVVFKPRMFGYGHEEAAKLIHARDPDAIQIGSLLGRFTLHFYNGQRTYHWFVPHDTVNASIERGELRYIVIDTHLSIAHEKAWMEGLVKTYDGRLIASYQNDRGNTKVWVYELPALATAP